MTAGPPSPLCSPAGRRVRNQRRRCASPIAPCRTDKRSEEAEDLNASSDEDADEGIRAVSLESDATEDGAEGAQIVGATGGVAETSSENSDDDDDEPVEVEPPPPSARLSSAKGKGRAIIDSDDSDAAADAPIASTSSQAGKLTADKRAELLAKKRKSRF